MFMCTHLVMITCQVGVVYIAITSENKKLEKSGEWTIISGPDLHSRD